MTMGKRARRADGIAQHPVAAAYWTARTAGLDLADAYRAAIDEWRLIHPGDDPRRAAQNAVALALEARAGAGELAIGRRELACLAPRAARRR
jgi:hypothetical protein